MDVFVFCFWQMVLGSIQPPPTTKNIFVIFTSNYPASQVVLMNYATILRCAFSPQEGVSPKKKDVIRDSRKLFLQQQKLEKWLEDTGRLKGHMHVFLLLEFVPLQGRLSLANSSGLEPHAFGLSRTGTRDSALAGGVDGLCFFLWSLFPGVFQGRLTRHKLKT